MAILVPIAFQFARRAGRSPSLYLMPMSFGALLGGLMTQVGTSPNIIVSRVREDITGTAFTMFDFMPVGAALAAAGAVFLILFYWLVPERTREHSAIHEALDIQNYLSEAKVTATSVLRDKPVSDLLKLAHGVDVGGAARQLEDRGDRRQHLVVAGLAEQRAIVAQRLVGIGPRQVEDLEARPLGRLGADDVVAGRKRRVARDGGRQVAEPVDDDDPAAHGQTAIKGSDMGAS